MGTSVQMIEKHYSHLKVRNTMDQLRRDKSKKILASGRKIDSMYDPKPPKNSRAPGDLPNNASDAVPGDDE
jgi:hypothetical protein